VPSLANETEREQQPAALISYRQIKMKPIIPPPQLAIGWLTMFLVGTELFVFSPLLPMLRVSFGVSAKLAGLCVTAFALAYAVSAPLFGHISDRFGRRRVLICCLFAFGAANLCTATASTLPALLAARIFAGAAAGGVAPTVYALVSGTAPPDRRASWLALSVSGLLAALAFGASLGGLIGAHLGWTVVFGGLASFGVVLAWLNIWVWPIEHHHRRAPNWTLDPLPAGSLARRLAPTIVWSTGLYGVYTYLGIGLNEIGFSAAQIARAIMFYGCGAIAGTLVGGRLADRFGAKSAAGASLAGLSLCFLLLLVAFRCGVLVDPILGVSSAVAQFFFPAQQAGLANDFPTRRSTALAWNNSALFLGISFGSLITGQAITSGSFETALTICAGIVLGGCMINRMLVPDRPPGQTCRDGPPT
jgi:predicted MFS family arabinose efflux permease